MSNTDEIKMNFSVLGMTCTTCSGIAEEALAKVNGVTFASVNLTTKTAFVVADSTVTFEMLENAVKSVGYSVSKDISSDLDEKQYKEARLDLLMIWAVGLPMSILMFLHMIYNVSFSWYPYLEIIAAFFAIFYCGRKTIKGAWIAFVHFHTNMDSLITISAIASLATSLLSLLGLNIPSFGTVGIMILMLHLTGRYIESRLRDRATKEVKKLLTLQPKEARVLIEDNYIMVPIEAIKPETLIRVNAGERIPLDGIVTSGLSEVDESLLTGESLPIIKDVGSDVTGGAMNLSGSLIIKTTKIDEETFLAKMIDLVRETQSTKVPLQALADRVTLKFVPTIISLAIISALSWFFAFDALSALFSPLASYLPWPTAYTSPIDAAVYAFVATLVIACPCALGLAIPLALAVSTGEASKSGLLIRNAEAIQTLNQTSYAILDKTGTLTKGTPTVTKWELPEEARPYAYKLESLSGHPVAKAVVSVLTGQSNISEPDELIEKAGEGISGKWGDDLWFVGRPLVYPKEAGTDVTVVEVRKNETPLGYFAITDSLREDSSIAIENLKSLGITSIMATGDRMEVAMRVARDVGIKEVHSEIHPEDKLSLIQKIQVAGSKVLMVGDGINDAAALRGAHVGIAMGSGMDLAVDNADIVIVKGGLSKVVSAVRIAKKTKKVIYQNLFGAFLYNIIAIPLAMSGLLHPIVAEVAMAASSITVILNSMRIVGSSKD